MEKLAGTVGLTLSASLARLENATRFLFRNSPLRERLLVGDFLENLKLGWTHNCHPAPVPLPLAPEATSWMSSSGRPIIMGMGELVSTPVLLHCASQKKPMVSFRASPQGIPSLKKGRGLLAGFAVLADQPRDLLLCGAPILHRVAHHKLH